MKKTILQGFIVALLSLCSAAIFAQGLYQGLVRVDRSASNSAGIILPAGDSCTITAELPTTTDQPTSIKWFASGGVYFINNGTTTNYVVKDYTSSTDLSISVYSKDGVTKEEGYSMFAKGLVEIMFVYESGFCAPAGFNWFVEGGIGYVADVYKTFDPVVGVIKNGVTYKNEIVGEMCVTSGKDMTFSVEPWVSSLSANTIGFDEYSWSGYEDLAVGGTLKYASNDNSSITFTVKDNVDASNATITCNIGKKNADASKTLLLTLMDGISEPTLNLSSESPETYSTTLVSGASYYNCIPYELDELSVSIADHINWAYYTWTVLKNNSIVQTGYSVDDNDVLTIFDATGNNYTIILKVEGGSCSVAEYTYNVRRQLPKAENLIVDWVSFNDDCFPQNLNNAQLRLLYNNGTSLETLKQSYYLQCVFSDSTANGWLFTNNSRTTSYYYSSAIRVNTGYDNTYLAVNPFYDNYCPLSEPIVKELIVKPNAPTAESSICVPYPTSNGDNSFVVELEDDVVAQTWHWILPDNWTLTANDNSSVTAVNDERNGQSITCFETTTNAVTIIPNDTATVSYITVKAIGSTCNSDWTNLAIGYSYPTPTIDVEGSLVPGGRVYLTAVGGSPDAQYSWDVSAIADSSAISNGSSLNNSSVYFDVVKRGPSARYPIYLTTTNSCSSSNIVAEYVDVTASYYISYKYQLNEKNNRTILSAVSVDGYDIDDCTVLLSAYRITSNGDYVLLDSSETGKVYVNIETVGVGESIYFILQASYGSQSENILEGTIVVPSITNVTYYIYAPSESSQGESINGQNKSLRLSANVIEDSYAYPNPTNGKFKVKLNDIDVYEMKIYNVQGALVKLFEGDDDIVRADISELPSGSYTYIITQNEDVKSGIVIKK